MDWMSRGCWCRTSCGCRWRTSRGEEQVRSGVLSLRRCEALSLIAASQCGNLRRRSYNCTNWAPTRSLTSSAKPALPPHSPAPSPSPPPRPRRQRDGARKVTTAAHHLPPLLPLSTPLAPHFDPSRPAALPRPPLPPPASPPLSPPLPSHPARPPRPLRTLLHDVPRRALPPLVD